MRALAFIAATVLGQPALSDTPLPAPESWQAALANGITIAALAPDEGGVTRVTRPDGSEWVIPGWHYRWSVHPSPDGAFVLISNHAANLIAPDLDPEAVVLRLWAAPGLPRAEWTFGEISADAQLQPTASHVLWIERYDWRGGYWDFEVPGGGAFRLFPDAGTLVRLP